MRERVNITVNYPRHKCVKPFNDVCFLGTRFGLLVCAICVINTCVQEDIYYNNNNNNNNNNNQ